MKQIALICASTAMLLAVPAGAHGDGNAARGKTVAEQHCARCHVVGEFNPHGGINSTPSFQLLAKRDDWLERFLTFFERRPHPVFVRVPDVERWTNLPSYVFEFEITTESIDDIIAFVKNAQTEVMARSISEKRWQESSPYLVALGDETRHEDEHFASAAARNTEPILDVLRDELPQGRTIAG